MFERFTDRARRVVVLAQEEARLLNHNYIGTEHVLLGLVHEGDGVAARALDLCDVSLDEVRAQVTEIIGQGGLTPSGHIPFTPRAKKVLELSLREALQLGHNYIGTEHILLGLIREGEGVAAQVLAALGLDLSYVRAVVVGLVTGDDPEPPPPGGRAMTGPARARAMDVPAVVGRGPRPATCSFCGLPSPMSGRLFSGNDGVLICERCARRIVGQLGPPSVLLGRSGPGPFRMAPEPDLDELVAAVVPTGPPPADDAAARADIERAFAHATDRTPDGRGLVNVQDAEDLGDYVDLTPGGGNRPDVEVVVDAVVFVSDSEAVVWTTTRLNGTPVGPLRHQEGRMVHDDGVWKLTRATMTARLGFAGVHVPPRDDGPPAQAPPA